MSWIERTTSFIHPELWPAKAITLPRIQNHRGLHLQGVVENSIEAFRQARERGGLCCELDVRLSKDKIPMVFHDENLFRLFTRAENVQDILASELEQLGIPSLAKVLADTSLTPFFNVELKSKIIDDPLPRKVAEVVTQLKAESRIIFSSFNPVSLYIMQNYLPQVPRALLATDEVSEENPWYLRQLLTAPFLRIHMLNLDKKMLTNSLIHNLVSNKIPFAVWTVNEESEVRRYLAAGAKSVITDLNILDHNF